MTDKLRTRDSNINRKPEPQIVLSAILRAKRKEDKKSYKSAYILKTYSYTVCSLFNRIEDEEFKDDMITGSGSSFLHFSDG